MRVVEIITPTNADKTFMGHRDIKLELDTETDELELDMPAMLSANPTVKLTELLETLRKLDEMKKRVEG